MEKNDNMYTVIYVIGLLQGQGLLNLECDTKKVIEVAKQIVSDWENNDEVGTTRLILYTQRELMLKYG